MEQEEKKSRELVFFTMCILYVYVERIGGSKRKGSVRPHLGLEWRVVAERDT